MSTLKRSRAGIILLMISISVLSLLTGCIGAEDDHKEAASDKRTLVVAGVGQVKGKPDTATVQLGVSVNDEDIGVAIAEVNSTLQDVTEALSARGIRDEDVQTTFYNVWKQEVHDPETGMPMENSIHHVESSLAVTVRNIDDLAGTIDAGLAAGANNIMGIYFEISDTSLLESQARSLAMTDAQNRAQEIALTMGLNLGEVISISEGGSGIPGTFLSYGLKGDAIGIGGGSPAPLSPGQTTIVTQINLVYEVVP